MAQGKAPIGNDGKPVELHHVPQTQDGVLTPMTRKDHREGDNFKKNHSNTGQAPSNIDRAKFKSQREKYWKDKAKKPE
jgi:filamentous hemagglutinin